MALSTNGAAVSRTYSDAVSAYILLFVLTSPHQFEQCFQFPVKNWDWLHANRTRRVQRKRSVCGALFSNS